MNELYILILMTIAILMFIWQFWKLLQIERKHQKQLAKRQKQKDDFEKRLIKLFANSDKHY